MESLLLQMGAKEFSVRKSTAEGAASDDSYRGMVWELEDGKPGGLVKWIRASQWFLPGTTNIPSELAFEYLVLDTSIVPIPGIDRTILQDFDLDADL